jgi:phosphopantothenoylcysteine decarboxylase/phosphopantothenate--cysteine ligase
MGFAIAHQLAQAGASVILIAGPVSLSIHHPEITRINVRSAQQMHDTAMQHFPDCDAAILSAAVADYTPVTTYSEKIKKKSPELTLSLRPNPDIAYELGQIKKNNQVMVGFALETHNEHEFARAKMKKKNFDFIVLNSLQDKGAGFGVDTNKVTFIDSRGHTEKFVLKSKNEVAMDIINKLALCFK